MPRHLSSYAECSDLLTTFITTCQYKIDLLLDYILCSHLYIIQPHPPTNLSGVIQCNRGYEIQIDWQVNTIISNYLILLQSAIPSTAYLHVIKHTNINFHLFIQPLDLKEWYLQTD